MVAYQKSRSKHSLFSTKRICSFSVTTGFTKAIVWHPSLDVRFPNDSRPGLDWTGTSERRLDHSLGELEPSGDSSVFPVIHRSMCRSKESDQYERIHQDGRYPTHSNSCALKPGQKDNSLATSVNRLSWHHEVLWVLLTLATGSVFVCTIAYLSCSLKSASHLWESLIFQDTFSSFLWRSSTRRSVTFP